MKFICIRGAITYTSVSQQVKLLTSEEPITARQAVMLNKAAEELPSESDITGADDIELQGIAEKASGIISQIKDVKTDTEDLFEHPLR